MTVVDTSELLRPTQRKLHAAWQELHGRKVLATPTVARELAPLGADVLDNRGHSAAEIALRNRAATLSPRRRAELQRQQWWATMWQDHQSPYGILSLTDAQEELVDQLLDDIDSRCFPRTDPVFIDRHPDARIVCESIAVGATMLLTSNMQTIDHIEVNRWAIENAPRYGLAARPVLRQADDAFLERTTDPVELETWLQAGLLASWPDADDAPARKVIERTIATITAMTHGTGGKLPHSGARLINGLRRHPDPIELVNTTRRRLPSPTVDTDRAHPSYGYTR